LHLLEGGINLRPKDFKKIIRKAQTEKIREIKNVKESLLKAKQGTKTPQWICNNLSSGKNSFVHKLPIRQWKTNIDKKVENIRRIDMSLGNGDRIWVKSNSKSDSWNYKAVVNGSTHEIVVDGPRNTATIITQEYPRNINVSIDKDQRTIILSRSNKGRKRGLNPPFWMKQE